MSQQIRVPAEILKRQKIGDLVFLGGGGLLAFGLLSKLLPTVLTTLDMIQDATMKIVAIALGCITLAIVAAVGPTLIQLARAFSRWATGKIRAVDPIGYMREKIGEVERRVADVTEKFATLKGVKKEVAKEERDLLSELEKIQAQVQVVDEREDPATAEFLARDYARKEEALANVRSYLALFDDVEKKIQEVRAAADIKLRDLRSELAEKERQWRIAKASAGLTDAVRAILGQDDNSEWKMATTIVDSSFEKMCADIDLLSDDMRDVIARKKLDGKIAVARLDSIRGTATSTPAATPRVRVALPETTQAIEAEFIPPVSRDKLRLGKR